MTAFEKMITDLVFPWISRFTTQLYFTVLFLDFLLSKWWSDISGFSSRKIRENGTFTYLGVIPCKAKEPVWGMELQEKEHFESKQEKLFRKNLKMIGLY